MPEKPHVDPTWVAGSTWDFFETKDNSNKPLRI